MRSRYRVGDCMRRRKEFRVVWAVGMLASGREDARARLAQTRPFRSRNSGRFWTTNDRFRGFEETIADMSPIRTESVCCWETARSATVDGRAMSVTAADLTHI